jgi:hypothetical protein
MQRWPPNQVFRSSISQKASLWRDQRGPGGNGPNLPGFPSIFCDRSATLAGCDYRQRETPDSMADQLDDKFYSRADAHIHLANDHLAETSREMANASLMFASARFSAFASAHGFDSGEAMAAKRDETIEYFVAGFRQMLEGNLDAYIKNFDAYLKSRD